MKDGKKLSEMEGVNRNVSDQFKSLGVKEGDNILQVDNSLFTGPVGGETYQGGTVGETSVDAINHEVGHMVGFDDRYFGGEHRLKGFNHPNFLYDYMMNEYQFGNKTYNGTTFNDVHYVHLLDYALKNVKPGETKSFGVGTSNGPLIIDNTNSGNAPMSQEQYQKDNSRVVKQNE